jgi:hypothetical protein
MNHLFLRSLLVIGIAFGIVSCSDDEVSPAPTIIGKWNVNTFINTTKIGTTILLNDTAKFDAGEFTIEFSANKAYNTLGPDKDTVEYTFKNNTLTFYDYDPIDGYDTTVFNYVNLTSNGLIIASRDTTITTGGELVSNTECRMTK